MVCGLFLIPKSLNLELKVFLLQIPGFRQFQANISATLRSRASIKSEDDLPPPYEAQISPELAQQSPPPYHVAIAIEMTSEENSDNTNYPENSNLESNYPSSSHED